MERKQTNHFLLAAHIQTNFSDNSHQKPEGKTETRCIHSLTAYYKKTPNTHLNSVKSKTLLSRRVKVEITDIPGLMFAVQIS